MIKCRELTDPKSCMSRAKEDEMTFVLLGRDPAAPDTIRFWVEQRVALNKNSYSDPQIQEALGCAAYMEIIRYPNKDQLVFELGDAEEETLP